MRELPDGEGRSIDRTRRKHRGHSRAILESGIEHRLSLGDLVTAGSRDVLDRDGQVPDFQAPVRDMLDAAAALDEHAAAAGVHHDFRDGGVDQEIFNRLQERQDAIKAAHMAPRSRCSK
jgi:hypothetical protein